MHRDKLTKKLERIIETIERGETPTRVYELYVFGSYRRGAIECGDLDLIVVLEPWTDELIEKFGINACAPSTWGRFDSAVRRSLVRRGEKIQLLICQDVSTFVGPEAKIKPSDVQLLWADGDRRWRERLAGIEPDPEAGRYERNHFIDLMRTGSDLETMEEVLWLLARKRLKLIRKPLNSGEPRLSPAFQDLVRRAAEGGRCGRDTIRIFPYAIDWIRRETGLPPRSYFLERTEIWSKDMSRRVHMGKISLHKMLCWLFHPFYPSSKVCLIPHIRRNQPNEYLIFQRGARWKGDRNEYSRRQLRTTTSPQDHRDTPF